VDGVLGDNIYIYIYVIINLGFEFVDVFPRG